MGDGWNNVALFRTYLRCQNHKRRIYPTLKIISSSFFSERRRKRPPPFSELHGIVHFGVHFRIARVSENRAAAQGTRAKFHTSLEPAQNFPMRKKFRRDRRNIGKTGIP